MEWLGIVAEKLLGWIPKLLVKWLRPHLEEVLVEIVERTTRPVKIANLMRTLAMAMETKGRNEVPSGQMLFSATEIQDLNHLILLLEQEGVDTSILNIKKNKPNDIFQWLNSNYPYAKEDMLENISSENP